MVFEENIGICLIANKKFVNDGSYGSFGA